MEIGVGLAEAHAADLQYSKLFGATETNGGRTNVPTRYGNNHPMHACM